MAIGTTAALLIGGGLLGSAALSSNAAKSAGNKVSNAADRAAELQNQQFEKQLALMMPGYQRAEQAAGLYGAALGIPSMTGGNNVVGQTGFGGGVTAGAPFSGAMTGGSNWNGYLAANPDVMASVTSGGFGGPGDLEGAAQRHYQQYGQAEGRALPGAGGTMTGGQSPAMTQQGIIDQVRNTPGYQGQLDQGIKSIDRASPLVGGMYSGRRMKALNDYGQNTFGSYYQDWLGKVGGVAGQAPAIAQNVGAAGAANANNVGGLMVQGANARANATQNSANAWTGAIGTATGLYGGSQGWFGR